MGSQVSDLADRILALADRVTIDPDPETERLFTEATATYQQAQTELEQSSSLEALEGVSDRLDHARWQLEAVAARLDGARAATGAREGARLLLRPHARRRDPGRAARDAAGPRDVAVCSACAGTLRAGAAPSPGWSTSAVSGCRWRWLPARTAAGASAP